MKSIKKDLFFVIPMVIINIILIMLKLTGLLPHIILSAVGVGILVLYAILTHKEWKLPALEIIMRVLYAIALITGIIIINVHGILALSIIHKICAILSFVALIALLIHKILKTK